MGKSYSVTKKGAQPMKKLIYLASPYTHDDRAVEVERFRVACRVAAHIMRKGDHVFSPIAHSHNIATYGLPSDFDFWREYDERMIYFCDSVAVVCLSGWETSRGVQGEIRFAEKLGKRVRLISLAELRDMGIAC